MMTNIKILLFPNECLLFHFMLFLGDINQENPIDAGEDEFMRLAILGRGKIRPYYGNVIVIVPAKVKEADLDKYCNNKLHKYNAYIGTSAEKGACIIHQMLDALGNCSAPTKMLMEKEKDGKKKWAAYLYVSIKLFLNLLTSTFE